MAAPCPGEGTIPSVPGRPVVTEAGSASCWSFEHACERGPQPRPERRAERNQGRLVKSGACWHSGRRYAVPHNVENSPGREKNRVPSENAARCDVSLQVPTTSRRGQIFV